jgi:Fe-S-cluster containining protein
MPMSNAHSPNSIHACREACGACCIAPSISSPIPGMPEGKPAGVRCVQLGPDLRCAIFGDPHRPACCSGLQPSEPMCGDTRDYALAWLTQLEFDTRPDLQPGRI